MDKCSFCGREKKDANILIAGVSGHICDVCVEQAMQIVKDELHSSDSGLDLNNLTLKKPKEIKEFIHSKRG